MKQDYQFHKRVENIGKYRKKGRKNRREKIRQEDLLTWYQYQE